MDNKKETLLTLIKQLTGDLMKGSLAHTAVTCGKKNCRCQRGEKHKTAYFSYRVQGKQKVIHVSHKMIQEVERLTGNWQKLKDIIEKLTAENARLVTKGK